MLRLTLLVLLVSVHACACAAPNARPDVLDTGPDVAAEASFDTADVSFDSGADIAADVADVPAAPIRVLFIGNSYTFVSDLPAVFRSLALATGVNVEIESVVAGSATLGTHFVAGMAVQRIRDGRFSFVVLQGQSLEPVTATTEFLHYGRLLAREVTNAGAVSVWFSTWARRAGDVIYTGLIRDPDDMNRRLENAYVAAARHFGGRVARVGSAWRRAAREIPTIPLHVDDGSHPTIEGTLLAACTIFHTVAQRAAVLPSPAPLGLDAERARAICAVAFPSACAASTVSCAGSCIDTGNDFEHCGACMVRCEGPRDCQSGTCQCRAADVRFASYAELGAIDPGCTPTSLAPCLGAVHRWCATQPCATTGFGPVYSLSAAAHPICLDADVRTVPYSDLSALVPSCDGVAETSGANCSTAIDRFCVARGAVGGFGPVGLAPAGATVACVTRAAMSLALSFADLRRTFASCRDATTLPECAIAAHRVCVARGHLGGVGPTRIEGDAVTVLCVDR